MIYRNVLVLVALAIMAIGGVCFLSRSEKQRRLVTLPESIVRFCSKGVKTVYRKVGVSLQVPEKKIACLEEGMAFFTSDDGKLMTSAHLIADDALSYEIRTLSGKVFTGELISLDRSRDIAVLQIPYIRTVPLQFVSGVTTGDPIHIVHYSPGGYETLSGKILALDESANIGFKSLGNVSNFKGLLLIDLPLEPGDSGGPLLDQDGRVVGINMASREGGTGGYALDLTR